jgi:hypothetical protein
MSCRSVIKFSFSLSSTFSFSLSIFLFVSLSLFVLLSLSLSLSLSFSLSLYLFLSLKPFRIGSYVVPLSIVRYLDTSYTVNKSNTFLSGIPLHPCSKPCLANGSLETLQRSPQAHTAMLSGPWPGSTPSSPLSLTR